MENKVISVYPKNNRQKERVLGVMQDKKIEVLSSTGNIVFMVPCDILKDIIKTVRMQGIKIEGIKLYDMTVAKVVMEGVFSISSSKSLF